MDAWPASTAISTACSNRARRWATSLVSSSGVAASSDVAALSASMTAWLIVRRCMAVLDVVDDALRPRRRRRSSPARAGACRRPRGRRAYRPCPAAFPRRRASRMVRESTWEETAKAMRRGDVGLDDAGDDVDGRALGGDDEVDAAGARQLRQAADGSPPPRRAPPASGRTARR